MKQFRIILMALFALFALGAVTAASASAVEEGFLLNSGTGIPTHFLFEGGVSTFETAKKGSEIKCTTLDDSLGTLESDTHGTVELHWLSCTASGLAANSKGDKSGIILAPVLLLVCLIDSAKLLFGIFAETDKPVTVEIPALGLTFVIAGAAIGHVLPGGDLHETKHIEIDFIGEKGVQNVKECKDAKGNVKKGTLTGAVDGGAAEAASENVKNGLVLFLELVLLMDGTT